MIIEMEEIIEEIEIEIEIEKKTLDHLNLIIDLQI